MENANKKPQQLFTKQNNTKQTPFTERKSTELLANNKASWPVSSRSTRRRDQPSAGGAPAVGQARFNNNNNFNNFNNFVNKPQQQQQPHPLGAGGKYRTNGDKRPRPRANANGGHGGGSLRHGAPLAATEFAGDPSGDGGDADGGADARELDDFAAAGTGLASAHAAAAAHHHGGHYGAGGGGGVVPKRRTPTVSSGSGTSSHDFEMNSIYAPGSKKQNLNHLLNFHYGDHAAVDNSLNMFGRGNHTRHGGHGAMAKGNNKHKFNKEVFMQANFQFVIKSLAKPLHMYSPDALIDWDLIEQINIQTTEEPQCPICLYPPIAAKLTRCGHAYCWPCLLHYLALSEKTWRKCPICYEAIHIGDLKSTVIVQQRPFNVDSQITFQLMRRKKDSLLVEKHHQDAEEAAATSPPDLYPYMSSGDGLKAFSKLLLANHDDILSIIERERGELIGGEDATECLQDTYIRQALELLDERRLKLGKAVSEKAAKSPSADPAAEEAAPECGDDEEREESSDPPSPGPGSSTTKFYYFYQSEDGQNVFLHPLNVKMLQACYGSLEHGPAIISSRILQKEHHSMDEEHRRKFTCLSHLPLTCQFAVVEVELRPPIITEDIARVFKDDVQNRKKERQRREREERKREKHINEINDRQMGKLIASTAHLNLSSAQEFPTCGFEDYLSTGGTPSPAPKVSGAWKGKVALASRSSAMAADFWPSIGSGSSSSAAAPSHTTTTYNSYQELSTWGKPQEPRRHLVGANDVAAEGDELDGECGVVPMQASLSDVLAEAMLQKKRGKQGGGNNKGNNKDAATGGGAAGGGGAAAGGGGKKKRSKVQPLFSTGINFNMQLN